MLALKEEIRAMFLDLGADQCGFANIERFQETQPGFHPSDSLACCRTVIVLLKALPHGALHANPRFLYMGVMKTLFHELEHIGALAANIMEKKYKCLAVPMICDTPYDYWDENEMEGRGLLSMVHSAVLAGLGSRGKNMLLLNPQIGNRAVIGALLTDLDLPSDPLTEQFCLDDCRRCLDACPAQALTGDLVIQKRCRTHTNTRNARGWELCLCHTCRSVCPRMYGWE